MEKGDVREMQASCNSEFMERVMPEVEEAIRNTHHWVELDTPICLFLDNIGGHGTNKVDDKYVTDLKNEYNVICIHQRPRLQAMNMLNLGVWTAFQSVVEKLHFHQ